MGERVMLNDAQWARIESMLPGKEGDAGRHGEDNRRFVEAVLWIARTGSPWRALPPEFGHWNSTYRRFARWSRAGVWARVLTALSAEASLQRLFLDSTIIRAHQHASGAPKKVAHRPSGARAGA